jgi:hypothetical protein
MCGDGITERTHQPCQLPSCTKPKRQQSSTATAAQLTIPDSRSVTLQGIQAYLGRPSGPQQHQEDDVAATTGESSEFSAKHAKRARLMTAPVCTTELASNQCASAARRLGALAGRKCLMARTGAMIKSNGAETTRWSSNASRKPAAGECARYFGDIPRTVT